MKILRNSALTLLAIIVIAAVVFKDEITEAYAQATPIDYVPENTNVPLPSAELGQNAQWVSLFNGKDLQGWTPKFAKSPAGENYLNTFRVEDGLLAVNYSDYEAFDGRVGTLVSNDSFSHYILRFEYRFIGEQVQNPGKMMDWAIRNNGAMLHCQAAETMSLEQQFPVSMEAQLLGGLGDEERTTGNLCTPGTNIVMNGEVYKAHCTNSVSPTLNGDQWVKAEFEVLGSERIRHFINGKLVFEYEQPQYDPSSPDAIPLIKDDKLLLDSGHIGLQAESAPTQFRNIEIHVLASR